MTAKNAKNATATNKAKAETAQKAKPPVSKPQLRILQALAKAGAPLTKGMLVKASGVNPNWIAEFVGGTPNQISEFVSGKGPKKLVPAGFARIKELATEDGGKERVIEITSIGRKLVEKLSKDS